MYLKARAITAGSNILPPYFVIGDSCRLKAQIEALYALSLTRTVAVERGISLSRSPRNEFYA